MPLVGYLHAGSAAGNERNRVAFRKGLNETDYVEGQNVIGEYHGLKSQFERLQGILADLVNRRVAVIATPSHALSLAAKAVTATVPIVFGVGDDPVRLGLVASLARPGGNAIGINFFAHEVRSKRWRLLHDLVPNAVRIAVLLNLANATNAEKTSREVQESAPAIGLQIQIFNATTVRANPSRLDVWYYPRLHFA